MRKASMILGIIGGVLAILSAFAILAGGIFFRSAFPAMMEYAEEEGYGHEDINYDGDLEDFKFGSRLTGMILVGGGLAKILAGILGIVGGSIVRKGRTAGGILMLIGCIISLFTFVGWISFILLLLGGVFAFVKDYKEIEAKKKAAA